MTKAGGGKDGYFRRLRKTSLRGWPLASVVGAEETGRRGDEAWGQGRELTFHFSCRESCWIL